MIFVTVGTEKFPFDRLIKIIDQAVENKEIENNIFAQIGNCKYRPQAFPSKNIISFEDMVRYINGADITVCHAGIGSTLLAIGMGKVPILFPRKGELREHLDNHQLEFAKKMETSDKVLIAYEGDELVHKIKHYKRILNERASKGTESWDHMVNYLKQICR